jgi:hypothetical protein
METETNAMSIDSNDNGHSSNRRKRKVVSRLKDAESKKEDDWFSSELSLMGGNWELDTCILNFESMSIFSDSFVSSIYFLDTLLDVGCCTMSESSDQSSSFFDSASFNLLTTFLFRLFEE